MRLMRVWYTTTDGAIREKPWGLLNWGCFDTLEKAYEYITRMQPKLPQTQLEVRNPRGSKHRHTWTVVDALEEKELTAIMLNARAQMAKVLPDKAPQTTYQNGRALPPSSEEPPSPPVEPSLALQHIIDSIKEEIRLGTGGAAALPKGAAVLEMPRVDTNNELEEAA